MSASAIEKPVRLCLVRHRAVVLALSFGSIVAGLFAGCAEDKGGVVGSAGGGADGSTADVTSRGDAGDSDVGDTGTAVVDAAGDADADAALDAGCDAAMAFATDASTTFDANAGDADQDAGPSRELCIACATSNCKLLIDNCNTRCDCRAQAADMLGCFLAKGYSTGNWYACEADAAWADPNVSLLTKETLAKINDCMRPKCFNQCAPVDGGDGG